MVSMTDMETAQQQERSRALGSTLPAGLATDREAAHLHALLEVAYLAASADGKLADEEIQPVVPAVDSLPSFVAPSQHKLGGSWLGGLLKGFESRKQELREKVHARVEHLKEVAVAELLDAEPKLHAAIGQALAAEVGRAYDLQREGHQQALAAEYTSVNHERAKIAPLVESRDMIISRGVRLGQLIDALAPPSEVAAAS